jgi:hypothetical protein
MIFPSVHYGGRLPELTFVRTGVNTGNFSAYSFTATNIGDPHPSRLIVLAVIGEWTSVTVNGVSATRIATAWGNYERSINLWQANVPTGTVVPVALTSSFTHLSCLIGVWKILYLRSTTPADTDSSGTGAGDPNVDMSLNAASRGVAIAAAVATPPSANPGFTGVTKNFNVTSDDNYSLSGGHTTVSTSGVFALSVTTTSPNRVSAVCACWR